MLPLSWLWRDDFFLESGHLADLTHSFKVTSIHSSTHSGFVPGVKSEVSAIEVGRDERVVAL